MFSIKETGHYNFCDAAFMMAKELGILKKKQKGLLREDLITNYVVFTNIAVEKFFAKYYELKDSKNIQEK